MSNIYKMVGPLNPWAMDSDKKDNRKSAYSGELYEKAIFALMDHSYVPLKYKKECFSSG